MFATEATALEILARIEQKQDRLLMRQEATISTMNVLMDVIETTRDQLAELLEWANREPSSDLSDLIEGMTKALEALGQEIKAMPDAVADAIASRVRR